MLRDFWRTLFRRRDRQGIKGRRRSPRPEQTPSHVARWTPSPGLCPVVESLESRALLATITVTSLADTVTNDGQVTLREAIQAANTDTTVDGVTGSGADTIQFASSLTAGAPAIITLGGTELEIRSDTSILGPGADRLAIDANQASRIFNVSLPRSVLIHGLTITNGRNATGGGIQNLGNLTLRQSIVSHNTAFGGGGGGIVNGTGGILTVDQCSVIDNQQSGGSGGGIGSYRGTLTILRSNISGNVGGHGGGVVSYYGVGTLTIANSTISGNIAAGSGGGIKAVGPNSGAQAIVITHSTISGNTAIGNGGGIEAYSFSSLRISQSTIVGNTTASIASGGGVRLSNPGGTTLTNTIVAGNKRTDGTADDLGSGATLSSNSKNNLIGDPSHAAGLTNGVNGNIVGMSNGTGGRTLLNLSTVLFPVATNFGGPTAVIPLLVGSPALDAGNNTLIPVDVADSDGDANTTEAASFDQRGSSFTRVLNGTVDIGAFEGIIPGTAVALTIAQPKVKEDGSDNLVFQLTRSSNTGSLTVNFGISGSATLSDDFTTTGFSGSTGSVTFADSSSTATVIVDPTTDANFEDNDTVTLTLTSDPSYTISVLSSATGTIANDEVIVVDTLEDTDNGNRTASDWSLREAILLANSNPGADTIVFDPVLTSGGPATITLTQGELTVTDDLAIRGPTDNGLTISGNNAFRIFRVEDKTSADKVVSLRNLTLTAGRSVDVGGAIDNGEELTVAYCTILGNWAQGDGGGIHSRRLLTVDQSTITGNSTAFRGGAILNRGGTLTVRQSTIVNNSATNKGGGLFLYGGSVDVRNSIIGGNTRISGVQSDVEGDNLGASSRNNIIGSPTLAGGLTNGVNGNIVGTASGTGGPTAIDLAAVLNTTPAYNGGSTKTFALVSGSIAIDAGDNASLSADAFDRDGDGNPTEADPFDQRGTGFARMLGSRVDIGATEFGSVDLSLPAVTVAVSPLSTPEDGADNLIFTLTRTQTTGPLTVNYRFGGTATAGTDFGGGITGSETFADGASTATVTVDPLEDTFVEANEAVLLTILGGDGYRVGTANAAAGTITNDDTTFIVDTLVDESDGNFSLGDLSLREAIERANALSGSQRIAFASALTSSGPATITLNGTQLSIVDDLAIVGPGADRLTINANNFSRIFNINDPFNQSHNNIPPFRNVSISGLTLTGGKISDRGGAIYTNENLTLSEVTIRGNSSERQGGGIVSVANLTVDRSTISGNTAASKGGGISAYGTMTIRQSTISGNNGGNRGGGIHTYGSLTLSQSTVVGNTATFGGGIHRYNSNTSPLTLTNTIVAGNKTSSGTATDLSIGSSLTSASHHNLIGDTATAGGLTNGVNGNIVGRSLSSVLNTTLANNGGPTLTHALITGSPALNAGDNAALPADTFDLDGDANTTEAVLFDQRGSGFARMSGVATDIGAVEFVTAPTVTVAVSPASTAEDGSGNLVFTFTRDVSTGSLTVNFSLTGSATSGTDYSTSATGSVTFADGASTATVTIDPTLDGNAENDETVVATVLSGTGYQAGSTSAATGSILNDDAFPTLSITAASASQAEGNSGSTPFTFTVTRTGDTNGNTSASFTVSGSGANAATANDFPLSSGTNLVVNGGFEAGNTGFTSAYSLYSTGTLSEGFYAVTTDPQLVHSGMGRFADHTPGSGTLMMVVNGKTTQQTVWQETVVVSPNTTYQFAAFSASPNTVTPPPELRFEINGTAVGTLSVPPVTGQWAPFSANWNSGTATSAILKIINMNVAFYGNDFTLDDISFTAVASFPSGTVSFAPGESSKTLTIDVSGDTASESDEGFTVTLSNATGASLSTASATGTILNDDASLTITATDSSKPEGNSGDTPFTFTVTRAGDTSGTASVDFTVTGNGSNAADAADFGGTLPSGTLNFAAGETTQTITLNISGDTAFEPDEGFQVTLSNAIGAGLLTSSATGTIRNDEAALSIAATFASKAEAQSGDTAFTFTVTRTVDISGAASVDFAVTGTGGNAANASDFGGSLPSGTLSFAAGETSQTITLNVSGDTTAEPDEGFTVTLSNVVGAGLVTSSATGTILNDDASLSIAATSASKNEGSSGSTAFTFTVTRTGSSSGTASADFTIAGSGANAADAADFVSTLNAAEVTLVNYGSAGWRYQQVAVGTLQGFQTGPEPAGFADGLAGFGNLAEAGLSTSTNWTLNTDMLLRREVTLGSGEFLKVGVAIDNDVQVWVNGVDISGGMQQSEDLAVHDRFIFSAPPSVSQVGTNLVAIRAHDRGGADFIDARIISAPESTRGALPSGTVNFAAGETTTTITINVNGDTTLEDNEGFTVTLSNLAGADLGTASASGTILSDDAMLAIAATDASKPEGHHGNTPFTFTVTRAGNTSIAASTNYAVTGGGTGAVGTESQPTAVNGSDFGGTLPSGTINFAAGDTTKTITLNVTGDTTAEFDEVFTVTLSNATGATLGTPSATGMILNDDTSLSIAATEASKSEGDSGDTEFTFTITRAGDGTGTASVDFAVTGSGSHAADGSDFGGGLPSGTLTFAAGETAKTMTVTASGDTIIEPDENFTVTLSNSVGAGLATSAATGTILNDDASLSIAAASATKIEGHSGDSAFTFTVIRTGDSRGAASVDFAVARSGINGADESDFGGSLPSGTLAFAAGETTHTISVSVQGDSTAELDEGFSVLLANPQGADLGTSSAAGTIIDDDRPVLRVTVDPGGNLSLIENGAGQSDDVTVAYDSQRDEFVIASTVDSSLIADGTTVTNEIRVAASQVTGGLIANLGGGDDRLNLRAIGLRTTVLGGAGNDTVTGSQGDDTIDTGTGDDVANGGNGRDVLLGGGGNDVLIGGAQNDVLNGGDGNDQLDGQGSSGDMVNGDAGDDTLRGGAGTDAIRGGDGFDTFVERQERVASPLTIVLRDTQVTGLNAMGEVETLTSVERALIELGSGDDRLDASAFTGSVTLLGGMGNDTLIGGHGDDVLQGQQGHDVLDGRQGNDRLLGGNGHDCMQGGLGNDSLDGGLGNDALLGGDGNDSLRGGDGTDWLLGEAGSDIVQGDAGLDRLTGGGNGITHDPGDQIHDTTATIDDTFSFNFDALLMGIGG